MYFLKLQDITDVDDYDPGSCDKSNVLKMYSVNDRNDKKKLWVCSKEDGKYLWKPVDGLYMISLIVLS